jgi:hypothetical protein
VSARLLAVLFASSSLALALAGCSVDASRNPSPRCDDDSQCTGGGTCYRGYCIGGSEIDAGPDARIDANVDAAHFDTNEDAFGDANLPDDVGTDAFVEIMCTEAEMCDDGDTCSGVETCTDNLCINDPEPDGTECDLDANIGTRDVCVEATCVQSRCGDSYTDTVRAEECDDGNDTIGDGCDDCRFTCSTPEDCDDGVECNGDEMCTGAHMCVGVADLANDTPCSGGDGTCQDGVCVPDSCTMDEECDDGNECNGVETCAGLAGCMAGSAMDCGDGNSCSTDTCEPGIGCLHALIDADGDSYSPRSAGPCGTDCDDLLPAVNPGAAEICGDEIDNNCNGTTDTDATSIWYADCDSDDYAATGAAMLTACLRPSSAPGSCAGGGWTARDPVTAADCNDSNAAVNPGQSMFQTTAIVGAPMSSDYDYNCNMMEQRRDTTGGGCAPAGLGCALSMGWAVPTPACGATANYVVSCTRTLLGCDTNVVARVQACL